MNASKLRQILEVTLVLVGLLSLTVAILAPGVLLALAIPQIAWAEGAKLLTQIALLGLGFAIWLSFAASFLYEIFIR